MKKIVIVSFLFLTACGYNSDSAKKTLEGAGYSDIKITGYAFLGCDEKDTVRTSFEATGPTGKRVEGAVCGGWVFKSNTIRLD